jgi:hypothetical protein
VVEVDGEPLDGCLPVGSAQVLSLEEAVIVGSNGVPPTIHGADLGRVLDGIVGEDWRRDFPTW